MEAEKSATFERTKAIIALIQRFGTKMQWTNFNEKSAMHTQLWKPRRGSMASTLLERLTARRAQLIIFPTILRSFYAVFGAHGWLPGRCYAPKLCVVDETGCYLH
jgi:hypothetical protein